MAGALPVSGPKPPEPPGHPATRKTPRGLYSHDSLKREEQQKHSPCSLTPFTSRSTHHRRRSRQARFGGHPVGRRAAPLLDLAAHLAYGLLFTVCRTPRRASTRRHRNRPPEPEQDVDLFRRFSQPIRTPHQKEGGHQAAHQVDQGRLVHAHARKPGRAGRTQRSGQKL